MRDEMDARIWVEHHQAFADEVDKGLALLRAAFARLSQWDGTTHQPIALAIAFVLTGLSFGGIHAAAA